MATLAIDDELYAEAQRRAAADKATDTAVVEAALRSYLGAGGLTDRIHERNREVSSEDVLASVYEELESYCVERDAS